ncbi:UNVERIFIED_CONTAM: hypothetical protein FKN15_035632 [Acipenser sinensis]
MCAIEAFLGAVAGLVTGWSLAFLAFERYIVICRHFGNFLFGSQHALMIVATTWVIGLSVPLPPFIGWSRYIPEGLQCSCGPDWYTTGTKYKSEYYTWFLFIFCFICPLSLICFSYSQLLVALRAVAAQQAESTTTQKAEREVSRMVIFMVGSFVFCYGPYATLAMYMLFSILSSSQGYLVFGKTMCAIEAFLGAVAGLVTGWSLAFLAFERYIVICRHFGNFLFGSQHALMIVATTWVAAQQAESTTMQKAEHEVSRMVIFTVGSFVFCYTPYAALAMYMFHTCIMETVFGKTMSDDLEVSSTNKTEVSSVFSSQVSPS